MEIKILCGGAIFTAFDYKEKYQIIEECRKHGLEAEIIKEKL